MKTGETSSDSKESVSVTIVTDNTKAPSAEEPTPPMSTPPPAASPPPPTPVKEDQNNETDKSKPCIIKRALYWIRVITFVLSLPVLFAIIWLSYVKSYNCEDIIKLLPKMQLWIIIGLVVVFVLSNLVAYYGSRYPVPGLLVAMIPLTLMFATGLNLIGAFRSESTNIRGSPLWIKMEAVNEHNWNDIKSCIYLSRTCGDLTSRSYSLKASDFTANKLNPLEFGCCKPPSSCDMEYVNATYWKGGVMDGGEAYDNAYDNDCNMWENGESSLCYHCYSCKLGFLKTLQAKWCRLGIFLVVMSVLLIIAHILLFLFSMWKFNR